MSWPTHIHKLVSPYLPHIYGWNDLRALGAGGVLLPCTYWVPPMVWFIEYPLAIQQQLQDGHNQLGITVNDGEMVASLFQNLISEFLAPPKFLASCFYCDNTTTMGQHEKCATRSDSPIPDHFLRALAMHRHMKHAGPCDVPYCVCGRALARNAMADFASQNVSLSPSDFLSQFMATFPLPSQLSSWQLVQPTNQMTLLVFSVLHRANLELLAWHVPSLAGFLCGQRPRHLHVRLPSIWKLLGMARVVRGLC
jgi:hypothetical protein